MNVEPFSCSFFTEADFIAYNRIENLRAATRNRAETSGAQSPQCVTDWHPENPLSQMAHLDRGKSLDVKVRIEGAKPLQKIQIPFFL
jgi:hypothetical protein